MATNESPNRRAYRQQWEYEHAAQRNADKRRRRVLVNLELAEIRAERARMGRVEIG